MIVSSSLKSAVQITEPPSLFEVSSMLPRFDLMALAAKDVVTITASATATIILMFFMIASCSFIVRRLIASIVNYKEKFTETNASIV
jgi:hypothetical protein